MSFPELPPRLRTFLFTRVSATGFGFMRIGWSLTVFFAFLLHIFSLTTSPELVTAVSLLFLVTLVAAALGIAPRCTVLLSVLLLFSFHERNPFILTGGDTLLRNIGFLLAICPELRACSLPRLLEQRSRQRRGQSPLLPLTMPIWPYRLLLWQMIVLYGSSLWHKLLGTAWIEGTAVATVLHHPSFTLVPPYAVDAVTPLLPLVGYVILLFHAIWLLLLIPRPLVHRLFPSFRRYSLKRGLLLIGTLFHGAIAVTLVTGTFPFAVFTAYLGLMRGEDLEALRLLVRRASPHRGTIGA